MSNSDFTTTDSWYNQDASAITLNSNGDVEIQGIGGEPAEPVAEGTTDEDIVANKYVYQTIPVNKANISFNISGTASAKSVPLNNEYRTFGISAKIKYKGDTTFTEEHYKEFNCATTIDQNVSLAVYPYNENKVISEVAFAFVYGYNKNRMIVKNAVLNVNIDYDIIKQIEVLDELKQSMIDEYNSQEYDNFSKFSDHKILCVKCENVTCNGETYLFNNKFDDIFDEVMVNFKESVEYFAFNNVNILIDTEVISDEIVCNSNYLEYEKVEEYIKKFSTQYEYDAVLVFCPEVKDYTFGMTSRRCFDPGTGFGYCCVNMQENDWDSTGKEKPTDYPYLHTTNIMIHEWLHTLEYFRKMGFDYPYTDGYQDEYSENNNSRSRNVNTDVDSSIVLCSHEDILSCENIQSVDVATIYENGERNSSSYSGETMLTNGYYSWPEYTTDGLEPKLTNFYKAVLRAEVYDISEERNGGMYPTFWEVRQRDCFLGRYKIQESISENYLYYVNDTTIGNSQSFVDDNTYRWNVVYNLFGGGVSIISAYDTSRRFDIDNLVVSPDCLKLWYSNGYYQAQSFDLIKNNNGTYSFLCKISNYTDYYMCLDNTLGFSKNSEYNKWNLILE